jgi:glycosyltransferase A (GT-A) superfamily protein (DUF2064 family)
VIIGSDIYELTSNDIELAFSKLNNNELVIGPALDGGYYLLGMNRLHKRLFRNKDWGTNTVLEDTLKDIEAYSVEMLSVKNDIDVYDDIKDNEVFSPFLKSNSHD